MYTWGKTTSVPKGIREGGGVIGNYTSITGTERAIQKYYRLPIEEIGMLVI